jgi:hypothetical protein
VVATTSNEPSTDSAVDRVIGWLCAGLSDAQVRRQIVEKLHPEAPVDELIEKARESIADRVAVDRDYQIGRAITRLDGLYAMAIAQQDVKGALSIQKELTRLLSLNVQP